VREAGGVARSCARDASITPRAATMSHLVLLGAQGACVFARALGGAGELELGVLGGLAVSLEALAEAGAGHGARAGADGPSAQGAGEGYELPGPTSVPAQAVHSSIAGGQSPSPPPQQQQQQQQPPPQPQQQEVMSVQLQGQHFLFRRLGGFTLVLTCAQGEGGEAARRALLEAEQVLVLLLGPASRWRRPQLSGLAPLLERCVSAALRDPVTLVGGTVRCPAPRDACERLEQLLAALDQSLESSHGAMLMVAGARMAVLHSRLSQEETRAVRQLAELRSLERGARLRVTPVHSDGQWKNLVLLQMRWHVLAVLVAIDAALPAVLPRLQQLEQQLEERVVQLGLPTAQGLCAVEDFGGVETLAFCVLDRASGRALCPELRQDPNRALHTDVLLWFLRRALDARAESGGVQLHLAKAGYRFMASCEAGTELYLLCGAGMPTAGLEAEAARLRALTTRLVSDSVEI
jgi:hypothetical protein